MHLMKANRITGMCFNLLKLSLPSTGNGCLWVFTSPPSAAISKVMALAILIVENRYKLLLVVGLSSFEVNSRVAKNTHTQKKIASLENEYDECGVWTHFHFAYALNILRV